MSKASIYWEERSMLRDLRAKCQNDEEFFNEVADILGPLNAKEKELNHLKPLHKMLVDNKIDEILAHFGLVKKEGNV